MLKISVLMLRNKPPKTKIGGVPTGGEFTLTGALQGKTQGMYLPEIGPDGLPVGMIQSDSDKKVDGRWVTLQEWSTCTLACGGGTQTLHRQCIPPLNGGRPCLGEDIQTKPCNTDPCKTVAEVEKGEELPMKLKLQVVSKRPQRYETCIIKEGDVDVVRTEFLDLKRKPRVPGRAILNNQTFSVYQGDDFDTLLFSAPIEFLRGVRDYKDEPESCFVVPDTRTGNRITLCSLQTERNATKTKADWVRGINFFKDNCRKPIKQAPPENPIIQMKKAALKKEEIEEESLEFGAKDNDMGKNLGGALQKLQTMAVDVRVLLARP